MRHWCPPRAWETASKDNSEQLKKPVLDSGSRVAIAAAVEIVDLLKATAIPRLIPRFFVHLGAPQVRKNCSNNRNEPVIRSDTV